MFSGGLVMTSLNNIAASNQYRVPCPQATSALHTRSSACLLIKHEGLLQQQGWMVLHNLDNIDINGPSRKPHGHEARCQLSHVYSK